MRTRQTLPMPFKAIISKCESASLQSLLQTHETDVDPGLVEEARRAEAIMERLKMGRTEKMLRQKKWLPARKCYKAEKHSSIKKQHGKKGIKARFAF